MVTERIIADALSARSGLLAIVKSRYPERFPQRLKICDEYDVFLAFSIDAENCRRLDQLNMWK